MFCFSFTIQILKQLISILFIAIFVVQTFNKPFIMMDYYANTAAYAKNCINKARPKMHCNGKCQAMKKIQEEEKKESNKEAAKMQYNTDIFYSSFSFITITPCNLQLVSSSYDYCFIAAEIKMPRSIFHPPSA